jgi:hypothetical protein
MTLTAIKFIAKWKDAEGEQERANYVIYLNRCRSLWCVLSVIALTLENIRSHIPGSFRLIGKLERFLQEIDVPELLRAKSIVDEVLSIVFGRDLASVQDDDRSSSSRNAISRKMLARGEEEHCLFERLCFIYFYDRYLKAHDSDMRKGQCEEGFQRFDSGTKIEHTVPVNILKAA